MQQFNNLILYRIYTYLPTKDLLSCSQVNKHFNKLFNNDILWDPKLYSQYSTTTIDCIKKTFRIKLSKDIYKITTGLDQVKKAFKLNTSITDLLMLTQIVHTSDKPTRIPKGIPYMINLKVLDLSYCNIKYLPTELFLVTSLISLNLSCNNICVLSKDISKLGNLQRLKLNDNKLADLPKEISLLLNLKELHLHNNRLLRLPKVIWHLINLEELLLHSNNLKSLPKEVALLKKLQRLSTHDNNFKYASTGNTNLDNLIRLNNLLH